MKSPNEEFCKAQFTTFLTTASSQTSIIWDEGANPPDYDLTIDGVKYAVEVTALMERIQVGSITLPESGIIDSLWSLVDEIEATAQKQNILTGSYVVGFLHPIVDFK
jgi:hypothetical protein